MSDFWFFRNLTRKIDNSFLLQGKFYFESFDFISLKHQKKIFKSLINNNKWNIEDKIEAYIEDESKSIYFENNHIWEEDYYEDDSPESSLFVSDEEVSSSSIEFDENDGKETKNSTYCEKCNCIYGDGNKFDFLPFHGHKSLHIWEVYDCEIEDE